MNNFTDLCPGCGDCKELCPFLAEYGTPDRILRERPEVAFYCTSCRRCDGVCPEGLSPSAAFFEVKRRMVRQDAIAPAVRNALDGARRFAKAGHTSLFSFYQSTDTVFWPGCGLAANRPGVVRKVKKILSRRLHRQVGLVLDCCHDPVYGLGQPFFSRPGDEGSNGENPDGDYRSATLPPQVREVQSQGHSRK